MKYRRIYWLLRDTGHSPVIAAEILLDAARGVPHAMRWVKLLFKCRPKINIAFDKEKENNAFRGKGTS